MCFTLEYVSILSIWVSQLWIAYDKNLFCREMIGFLSLGALGLSSCRVMMITIMLGCLKSVSSGQEKPLGILSSAHSFLGSLGVESPLVVNLVTALVGHRGLVHKVLQIQHCVVLLG